MLELDLREFKCPLPVLKTKKFLADLESGVEVKIYTTDPDSLSDLQNFCKKTDNVLLKQEVKDSIITTIIRRG